jgi:mRNA interferase RelE/StbE
MKKYVVRIPPEVESFVRHLHPRLKRLIRNALEALEENPYLGKPLKERLSGFFSLRVSHYRIIYRIKAREVLIEVVDIAERKIVYQRVAALVKKLH